MSRLATKIKNVVAKELKRKPMKKDYKDVEVVRKWIAKGEVDIFYKNRLLGNIKILDK